MAGTRGAQQVRIFANEDIIKKNKTFLITPNHTQKYTEHNMQEAR